MPDPVAIEVAWLVEFPGYTPPADSADAPTRLWEGEGDLEFAVDGTTRTWAGTRDGERAAVEAAPVQNVRQGAPSRTKIRILIGRNQAALRHLILRGDPGPIDVLVHFIYRPPGERDWSLLARNRRGQLSNGEFVGGAYEYELETYSGDVDRQQPRKWSNEQQLADHPGDRGLEFAADLAQGKDIRWPQSS